MSLLSQRRRRMPGSMMMDGLRRLVIIVAALAILGGGALQAAPVDIHSAAGVPAVSSAGTIDCMALMGHAEKDRSVPCKRCGTGCPIIADCAGLVMMAVCQPAIAPSVRSAGVLYFAPSQGHAGISVAPVLFPPIAS